MASYLFADFGANVRAEMEDGCLGKSAAEVAQMGEENMQRRDFLRTTLAGAGAIALSDALPGIANAGAGQCFTPWDKGTETFAWKMKKGPYKIALSNSYIGNMWRTEMIQIAKAYTEEPAVKRDIKQFMVSSAGNDVSAQIAQMNQMILAGVDAIVLDAASPTGLNSVIDQAVAAGILVVSFDNVVTTKKAVWVNQNQFEMGQKWAEWLVRKTGDKGNILVVRGVAGTFVDQERMKGGESVFKKYPGIKTTEVYGKWDDGTAQKVVANALASGTKFDAVWSEGGDTGVVRAFQQAGLKMPPIAGEAENGFRTLAAKDKFPVLSIGQSPALGALGIKVAVAILKGEKLPQSISTPLPTATNATLKQGVNYFPNLPDSFFTPISIGACGLNFKADKILKIKV